MTSILTSRNFAKNITKGRAIALFSLMLAVAFVAGFSNSTAQSNQEDTRSTEEPVVVAFGDSLTFGTGSTVGNDYVSVLSGYSNISIVNEGVSGDTTGDALDRLETDILSRNPDIVIVFLGGNDILQNVDTDVTMDNLRDVIEMIQENDAEVILVGTHRDIFNTTRERLFRELAQETESRYVPNVLNGILGNSALLADPVHPNDFGYRVVARRIWPELQDALNENFSHDLSVSCDIDDLNAQVEVGERTTWNSYVWGGELDAEYEFAWSGNGTFEDEDDEAPRIRYETQGTKQAQLSVTAGDEEESSPCERSVVVTAEPLAGSCEVEIEIDRSNDTEEDNEVMIRWVARAAGGDGTYDFSWSGSDGLSNASSTIEKVYTTSGIKEGTVTIESGDESVQLDCTAQLRASMFDSAITRPLTATCEATNRGFSIEDDVRWRTDVSGGETPITIEWQLSGGADVNTNNNNNGTSSDNMLRQRTVNASYGTVGTKEGTVTVTDQETDIELSCQIHLLEERANGGSGEGCFIATAAFGTEMSPELHLLRDFRDEKLLTNKVGTAFVDLYYKASPPVADVIKEHEWMRGAVRTVLYPVVEMIDLVQE